MDKVALIKERIKEIMEILEIPITESNSDTPKRVAKMWCNELFQNRNNLNIGELKNSMTLFPNDRYKSEMVIVKDIPFNSTCEHHWLPFSGTVTVGYVPAKTIIGLSKIPRVVKYFSKKPQLQEQFTTEIGDFLVELLFPEALFVEVEAKHQCVSCRGAESDCSTRTFYRYINPYSNVNGNQLYEDFKSRI